MLVIPQRWYRDPGMACFSLQLDRLFRRCLCVHACRLDWLMCSYQSLYNSDVFAVMCDCLDAMTDRRRQSPKKKGVLVEVIMICQIPTSAGTKLPDKKHTIVGSNGQGIYPDRCRKYSLSGIVCPCGLLICNLTGRWMSKRGCGR